MRFGGQETLAYWMEEKFLRYLEAAENDGEFPAEIPAYVGQKGPTQEAPRCLSMTLEMLLVSEARPVSVKRSP
jgi:hypothetical protein